VQDLYLDDNLVESIVRLEGSDWLDHFRLLNLRGNKLTDVGSPSKLSVTRANDLFHMTDIEIKKNY